MARIRYEITVTVPAHLVGTVFGVLKDEDAEISVKPVRTNGHEAPTKPRRSFKRPGPHAEDHILEALKAGPLSNEALITVLTTKGLAAGSLSPTTSRLKRDGKILWNTTLKLWKLA